jgi:transposase
MMLTWSTCSLTRPSFVLTHAPLVREKKWRAGGASVREKSGRLFHQDSHCRGCFGQSIALVLNGAGQCHDSPQASALIDGFEPQALIADKGYDSDPLIEAVTAKGIEAVIPPKKNRLMQREYDRYLYRERHLIECFINKIKQYRRVFSRFEKLSKNYLGFLSFVSALVWLR